MESCNRQDVFCTLKDAFLQSKGVVIDVTVIIYPTTTTFNTTIKTLLQCKGVVLQFFEGSNCDINLSALPRLLQIQYKNKSLPKNYINVLVTCSQNEIPLNNKGYVISTVFILIAFTGRPKYLL